MHIPGKRTRHFARTSGHFWTRPRLIAALNRAQQRSDKIAVLNITAQLNAQSAKGRTGMNQRQRRKARRQLYAAGARRSVAFA